MKHYYARAKGNLGGLHMSFSAFLFFILTERRLRARADSLSVLVSNVTVQIKMVFEALMALNLE